MHLVTLDCAAGLLRRWSAKAGHRPVCLDEVQIDDYVDRGEDFEMPAVVEWFWQRPIAETQTSKGAA